jgi:hypothetical protein
MTSATEQRIIAIVLAAALATLVLELVRRRRMKEQYALLWLATVFVLLLLAVWNGLLTKVSGWVGVHYPPTTLFLAALGLEIVLLLHFSVSISRLTDRNVTLAQQVALLKDRLAAKQRQLDALETKLDQDRAVTVDQAPSEPTSTEFASR